MSQAAEHPHPLDDEAALAVNLAYEFTVRNSELMRRIEKHFCRGCIYVFCGDSPLAGR